MRRYVQKFVFIVTIISFFLLMNFCCWDHETVAEGVSFDACHSFQISNSNHHGGHSHDSGEFDCHDYSKIVDLPAQVVSRTQTAFFELKNSRSNTFYQRITGQQITEQLAILEGKSPPLLDRSYPSVYIQISVLRI